MDELYKNLGSLSWWVGVVVVGVILNLVSTYLKSPIDALLSAASSYWRRRSERSRNIEAQKIEELRDDPNARNLLLAEEIRCRLRHLSFLLFAIFLLLFYVMIRVRVPSSAAIATDPVVYWSSMAAYQGSLLLVFFGIQQYFLAMSYRRLLCAASKPPEG